MSSPRIEIVPSIPYQHVMAIHLEGNESQESFHFRFANQFLHLSCYFTKRSKYLNSSLHYVTTLKTYRYHSVQILLLFTKKLVVHVEALLNGVNPRKAISKGLGNQVVFKVGVVSQGGNTDSERTRLVLESNEIADLDS